jgi:LacI family transcriptional regulator/LacI family asc operon transcriptional repressor
MIYLHDTLTHSGLEKLTGFQKALVDMGHDGAIILRCIREVEAAQTLMMRILTNIGEAAVVCSEDVLAIGALKAARQLGRDVPRQVEVVGFNNSLLCRCCQPELTSVDSQVQLLCTQAVARLMDILAGKKVLPETVVQGQYISRGTTLSDKEDS